MEELLRSNDPVYLSYIRHVLSAEGIPYLELDQHMSVLEGSVGAIPRRIMVRKEELAHAQRAIGNEPLTQGL